MGVGTLLRGTNIAHNEVDTPISLKLENLIKLE